MRRAVGRITGRGVGQSFFAPAVDEALDAMSLQVLRTAVRAAQANAHWKRFIGTARREWLDWVIPLTEAHFKAGVGRVDRPLQR
jgi:hypothetical protein